MNCRRFAQSATILFTAVFILGASSVATAQLPSTQLDAISPSGGGSATTVTATIAGKNLNEVDRLVFSHSGITAQPIRADEKAAESNGVVNQYKISIGADVPVGVYDVRVIGRFGVSNPRAFVIEDLQQVVVPREQPNSANHSVDKAVRIEIGSVASARVTKNHADYYRFSAKTGQAIIARCAGTRIDSRIDATLVLFDANGKELMRVRDTESYDPVMAFRVPADGEYTIEVYDFLYRGGDDYFYRLSLTERPFVEAVFPPVGIPGEATEYTVYGYHLPDGEVVSTGNEKNGVVSPLEKVTVRIPLADDKNFVDQRSLATYVPSFASMLDGQLYTLSSPQGDANAITIGHAAAPVEIEAEPNNNAEQAQNVSLPCEFAGQFQAIGDEDWVAFSAVAGERVWIDVISHRARGRTDPVILVEEITTGEDGEPKMKRLANRDDLSVYVNRVPNFETRSRDPAFQFVAKKNATYRVMIRDIYNMTRGDVRLTYRLVIGRGEPDFRLVAHGDPYREGNAGDLRMPSPVLRQGGTSAINVHVFRRFGFDGDIHVHAEGLPEGVTCRGAIAAGGASEAKLVFEVAEDAPASAAPIRIVGRADVDGETLVSEARSAYLMFDTENVARIPPTSRLVRQLWISVTDKEMAPATLHVDNDELLETSLGGQLALPFRVTRRDGFEADLRVAPEGLPRQLRLTPVSASGDKQSFNLKMKINNFPAGTYTFYLMGRGRYRSERNTKPVSSGDTEMKEIEKDEKTRFAVASPPLQLRVHATPVKIIPSDVERTVRSGETLSLPTTVERRFGFSGPVTLDLKASDGISADSKSVAKDQSEGALLIRVDKSVRPGEYQCEIIGQHVFGGLALAERHKFTLTVLSDNDATQTVADR